MSTGEFAKGMSLHETVPAIPLSQAKSGQRRTRRAPALDGCAPRSLRPLTALCRQRQKAERTGIMSTATPASPSATAALESSEIRRLANAIRALSMDAVQKAKSGHPGLPMGMADVATVLFSRFLKFDPADPHWPDRDRFVLSAGHGSMLLYSLLYLTGYAEHHARGSQEFPPGGQPHRRPSRIWPCRRASRPPPAPWARASPRRWAWRWPSACCNARFGDDLVDHKTYVIAGDGDLMEGISHEAIAPCRASEAQRS